MNAAKTAIIIDSGCDLSDEVIAKYDIKVLRLKVMYGETVYNDGENIDPLEVYAKFPQDVPKTSTPNMMEVLDLLQEIHSEGYERVIAITISSALSGTFNAVRLAFEEAEDDSDLKHMETYAFDTKNISIGSGLYAWYAAKELGAGQSFREVTAALERKIHDSKVFFYMDTLDYLKKGGRISPAVAIVGKALNLKPIISCTPFGTYYTVVKIRGHRKGIESLLEVATDFAKKGNARIGLMNGGAPDVADEVEPRIFEIVPDAQLVVKKQITATMAIHTGPGLIGIGVFLDD